MRCDCKLPRHVLGTPVIAGWITAVAGSTMRKHPTSSGHPRWVRPQQCITSEGAAQHTSTATRLTTGEQTFHLTLVQHDSHGVPELLMKVTDTAAPAGLQVLTVPEIKALAETLLIGYLKAAH